MTNKCGKAGCDKDGVKRVEFKDLMHPDVNREYPIALCDQHVNELEAQRFEETDVASVKRWLQS